MFRYIPISVHCLSVLYWILLFPVRNKEYIFPESQRAKGFHLQHWKMPLFPRNWKLIPLLFSFSSFPFGVYPMIVKPKQVVKYHREGWHCPVIVLCFPCAMKVGNHSANGRGLICEHYSGVPGEPQAVSRNHSYLSSGSYLPWRKHETHHIKNLVGHFPVTPYQKFTAWVVSNTCFNLPCWKQFVQWSIPT